MSGIIDLSQVRQQKTEVKVASNEEVKAAVVFLKNLFANVVNDRLQAVQDLLSASQSSMAKLQVPPGQMHPLQEKEMKVRGMEMVLARTRDALGAAKILTRLETQPDALDRYPAFAKLLPELKNLIAALPELPLEQTKREDAMMLATFRDLEETINLVG